MAKSTESTENVIIEFVHADLERWMDSVKAITDDCGIPMAARQKFANTVLRLLKSGKAFVMERAEAPGLVMIFKPSEKLNAAFDKIEAAR